MKRLALQGLGYFAIGAALLTGIKTADWVIPDPVRAPVQIQITECDDKELSE